MIILKAKDLFDFSKSGIILHKKGKILVRNINVSVTTMLLMFFLGVTPSRVCIFLDL